MTKRFLAATLAAATLALPLHAQTIEPKRLEQSARTLASDLFEGRAPGTLGEERTIGYLVARFEALGLEPGGPNGQWVQTVPLLHTKLGAPRTLGLKQAGRENPWAFGKQIYLSTLQPKDGVTIERAPLVFVGHGVSAPERGWDDFKGADLKGKIEGVGGSNSKGLATYSGPCPPVGENPHHYVIQIYALDLAADALPAGLTRDDLLAKIKGHILANTSVVRRYGR